MPAYTQKRPFAVFDSEVLPNYYSIGFLSVEDGRKRLFELFPGNPLDKAGIAKIVRNFRLVSFNGIGYDVPMLLYAMAGASNEELVQASTELIQYGTPHWVFMERHGLMMPDWIDHIDLMQVSPGYPTMPSLKLLGGRLHSRKIQEMPVHHTDWIDDLLRKVIRAYHDNDLFTTRDLYNDLKPQIDLRAVMSEQYGIDLRSKSDAQIAEAVIKTELERLTGRRFYKPDQGNLETSFKYKPPAFIQFETDYLKGVLETIKSATFYVDSKGTVHMPDEIKKLLIKIGDAEYQMGIGGIHSTESQVTHVAGKGFRLLDRDVTSFYPFIIAILGLFPKHLGPKFLDVYKSIISRRVAAKKAGEKNTAETLKIVLNGSFGKFGSPYSVLYSPDLMIQVTVTGQLLLLMLVEQMELNGMPVISANTDGFVTKVPDHLYGQFTAICGDWEWATGFQTEETEYLALHSRDVNNYVAVKRDPNTGKVSAKRKGAYVEAGPGIAGAAGQKKNPDMEISNDAAVAYLTHGTPVEKTIRECQDIRKFVVVRRVKGGAKQDDEFIGKVVRWYYATGGHSSLVYATTGNRVPMSIGAKPCMELPDTLPDDIDYDYYVREAYAILQDVGLPGIDPALRGRSGTFYGLLPKQLTLHVVDAATGRAACGKERESVRDAWKEYRHVPEGRKVCSKCRKADEL